jgi:hypothetical protein
MYESSVESNIWVHVYLSCQLLMRDVQGQCAFDYKSELASDMICAEHTGVNLTKPFWSVVQMLRIDFL